MLAGGFRTSDGQALADAYVYDIGQTAWLPGPPLPETRGGGRAVQYGDSFVIVGGAEINSLGPDWEKRGDILRYDADGNSWEVMEQRLENPDRVNTALIAPEGFFVNCS